MESLWTEKNKVKKDLTIGCFSVCKIKSFFLTRKYPFSSVFLSRGDGGLVCYVPSNLKSLLSQIIFVTKKIPFCFLY